MCYALMFSGINTINNLRETHMNPLAVQLNEIIEKGNPHVMDMLSEIGKKIFFPKGILSQSAEAREKAFKLNATIGIATEKGKIMCFPSVMNQLGGVKPEEALTYASSFGLMDLRKTWKEYMFKKNPSLNGKNISLPIVASGITHAISIMGDMFINPGDVVIVPDMMWGNYNMILATRKNARLSSYPLFNDNGGYNLEAFEAKIKAEASQNSKIVVILNFPNNPTGYAVSKTEGARIAEILTETAKSGTNVIAVCDDAYFGLYYEEETMKESIFGLMAGTHERLIPMKLDGATKENYVWGLRVAFITYGLKAKGDMDDFNDAVERKTAGCIRGNISNAPHLSQTIVLKSMQDKAFEEEASEKFEILKKRANRVKEVIKNPKYEKAFTPYPFNSGYFMCVQLKEANAEKLRVHLLEKYGVGVIALGEKNIRVAFSCLEEEDIQTLFDCILDAANDLCS
ncbi:aminotransferase class I/II-fold pyridoxal phosphate-dependent enzyme [Desulforegula conservatrix]|uniref:aminotransferase class I/II-fold pyridoxal phosphate-dependent enzyme n=1 Tax=Desulforegula conservatrix TaxID=153026 RepID=UPI002FBE0F01